MGLSLFLFVSQQIAQHAFTVVHERLGYRVVLGILKLDFPYAFFLQQPDGRSRAGH
ncbi:hypothetical protein D3C80_2208150 [compost metagenome]